ncbi:arginine N-methyltransferas-like protein [Aulographum hederae CBS 113979]|uniref:Protein arginine N-methyltransferase n=1 Tax=Aulographum hederae CBS 113979 TaxID=1176131 RepID=A0A6G1H8I2_9PEZI|nr:arginine N-methyltransferas-like protein [Aulographum hederae CBS 113979]
MESPTSPGDPPPVFYVGQHESRRQLPVSDHALRQAQDCNYDMLTTPITTPYFHSRVLTLLSTYIAELERGALSEHLPMPLVTPLKPIDTPLTPNNTISQLLAVTSPWIDLASPDPLIANLSLQVFNQELAYAAFCGVGNVIVQGPKLHHGFLRSAGVAQYARAIAEAVNIGPYLQIQILLPISDDPESDVEEDIGNLSRFARAEYIGDEETESTRPTDIFGTWDAWNVIRSVCKYSPRITVALSLPQELPPPAIQSRWYSEPLRLLFIPGTSFQIDRRGREVLSKAHQSMIARCMRLRHPPWLLLSDVGPIPGLNDPDMIVPVADGNLSPARMEDAVTGASPSAFPTLAEAQAIPQNQYSSPHPTPHLNYIRWLQRHQPARSTLERFGSGYQDYLQAPLQPLTDNLESITYEVFEKDPVKYDWYEKAIAQALMDWSSQRKPTSSPSGAVVLAVVGAGRGPLMTRALLASERTGVPILPYAVEKNPNAYVLLQRHNQENALWNHRVTVVKSDMRSWKGPLMDDGTYGPVDIMVSELLGSFADNELSPECLDGVQHVMNASYGISIPASYTAHLTPIAASKLYADISQRTAQDPSAFETPYVVMLHAIDFLSTVPVATYDPPSELSFSRRLTHIAEQDRTTNADPKGKRATTSPAHSAPIAQPDIRTCWEFQHPAPPLVLAQANLRRGGSESGGAGGAMGGDGANEHNARHCTLAFKCKNRGVCHGLAGYFETVLYDGGASRKVELSTNPITMEKKSRDMISWFPIFFPLKTPIHVPDNGELKVSMWRQTDDRKVWYEWLVEAFIEVGGQSVRLGLSELHSSKKNGCLM